MSGERTEAAAPVQVLTRDIRERLKQIALQELGELPDLLAKMEPKDRAQFALKLLTYVAPKVSEIGMYEGEPLQFDFGCVQDG